MPEKVRMNRRKPRVINQEAHFYLRRLSEITGNPIKPYPLYPLLEAEVERLFTHLRPI